MSGILQAFMEQMQICMCYRIAITILSSLSVRMSSLIFGITCELCAWNDLKAVVHRVIERIVVELYVIWTDREIVFGRETSNGKVGIVSQG
jgi:hypothetical protein